MVNDYSTVKIPSGFVDEIKKFIKEHDEFGYRTHSEFIIDAARRRLELLKKEKD